MTIRLFGLVALMIGLWTSIHAQTPPPCDGRHGTVERLDYRSDLISTDMVYSVYTPPCYETDTNTAYPVIYLMHGSNDDDGHWQRLGLIEALDTRISSGQMPPVIVVLPFGNWIANENRFGVAGWGEVFMGELLPRAESLYRIDPARRLIGGISRGGFWAYSIGLRHPDKFKAIGGHSAFLAIGNAPLDHNPLDLALSVEQVPALWLDRGLDDYAADGLNIMHQRLKSRKIPHTYSIEQGEHINPYWSARLGDYLDFYAAHLAPVSVSPFATSTPTPQAQGVALFLPVTAFGSTRFSLDRDALDALIAGQLDNKLTISAATVQALAGYGITLHPQTNILDSDEAVYNTLWRDRSRYTLLPFSKLTPRLRVLWVNETHPLDAIDAYPLAFESTTPDYDPSKLTRITLTGVTAITRNMIPVLDERGTDWAVEGIVPYLQKADFVHVSNEVSIYPGCPEASEQMLGGNSSFCSKPEHFDIIEKIGADIIELSGNHNNDYGYQPYLDTLAWFRERNMRIVGGGETVAQAREPLILEHNGNSIAWLACNWVGPYYALAEDAPNALGGTRPGAASCDSAWLRESVQKLSTSHDLLIVSVQYSEFDQHLPTDDQRADFARLAEWGADVVIGTQAHFPQTYDFVSGMGGKETFVHYGIGNFFFDQPFWATVRFMLDRLLIYDGVLVNVEPFPGIIDELARPRPMTPTERENFAHVLFVQNGGF